MELKHIAIREGRLSSFLKGEMGMSTGLMNKLKWGDSIRVNGQPEHTDYPVRPGDVITVAMEEQIESYPAEDGPLTVLFEDEYLLAVEKPAGMLIHPSRSRNTGTLANFVAGYYEKTGQKSAFHPLTRLDRDTFGIVLLAKSAHLHSLLQQSKVSKTYYALVYGGPAEEEGHIDAPIARRELPSLLRYVNPEGKPCLTEFNVLQRGERTAKLALRPVTGRTHQLRVHCAHMGFPILGDPQYGSEESVALSSQLRLEGQQLCAKELVFSHPITGKQMRLCSSMDVGDPI